MWKLNIKNARERHKTQENAEWSRYLGYVEAGKRSWLQCRLKDRFELCENS